MKKFLIAILAVGALHSCSNSGKPKNAVYYQPQSIEKTQQAGTVKQQQKSESNEFIEVFDSPSITLTVFSPAVENGVSYECSKLLALKLLRLVTANGIGCLGGDPTFALVPVLSMQNKGTTATIPSKSTITYTVTLYVGNVLTGEIYESTSINMMGVGNSYEKATINAINTIENSREIKQMLANARTKIVNSYESNPYSIINKVNEYISRDDIDFAYLLLTSVPDAATNTYALAQEYIPKVQNMLYLKHSENLLSRMKDAIAQAGVTYNPDVSVFHRLIPIESEQRVIGDKLFDEYMAKLDEHERQKREQEMYLEREELACKKLEMELNIQANQELTAAYKELAESRAQMAYNLQESSSEAYLVSDESNAESNTGILSGMVYEIGNLLHNVEQVKVTDLLTWAFL